MSRTSIALSIKNVTASYGRGPVIEDFSLDVMAGEMFGLMGLNGSGKTTLIKSILGLRDQDSGVIEIFGRAKNHPDSKQEIAYLPERFEPPWFLTGIEFIKFSCDLYKVSHTASEIHDAAEKLALDPAVLKNKTQTYSKGMRQKLGIAATLLTGCTLLILDEPMSGLDPKARALVKDALKAAQNNGKTIFLSSHILPDMDELCDHVALLHEGKKCFDGTPQDLKKSMKEKNMEQAFLKKIDFKRTA